jgi:RNA-directed DNA polymerase
MHEKINTLKKLSNFLNINSEILNEISENDFNILTNNPYNNQNLNSVLTVKKIEIRKKNGGVRVVYSPTSDNLTNCLKILNNRLKNIYNPPDCVHGYIKGKGIKTNAVQHLGKRYILKIDIENYFEKITKNMITLALKELGFHDNISSLIAKLTTHNDILVQGFHTSPTIANIIFYELDLIFSKFEKFTYTRYADDLYFSSEEKINIEPVIEKKLLEYGFTINHEKTKLMKRGQKQYITGLTVFDSLTPRVSKHKKKEIRQDIHYIQTYGFLGHVMHKLGIKHEDYLKDKEIKEKVFNAINIEKQRIKGWLLFINSIEPNFSDKYSELKK